MLGRIHLSREPRMQAIAESRGKLENPIVSSEYQNVPRGIQDGRADFTVLKVLLYQLFGLERQRIIEKFGDVVPDVLAFDYHGNHLRFLEFAAFSLGASSFCSMIRARCSRTFTDEILMASAEDVSSILSSSMSRNTNTSL